MAKKQTKHPGIRFREHATRKYGVNKDRYFFLRYTIDGHRHEEGLGWASDGWTLDKAAEKLAEIKAAKRTGDGPRSLKESREISNQKRKALEDAKTKAEKESLTFSQFFIETYLTQARSGKKPETIRRELSLYHNHVSKIVGDVPLRKISPVPHIEGLRVNMQKAGESPRSIQYAFALIRQVHNHAKLCGIVEGDPPTSQVRWPKVDNNRERFLDYDEASRLLAAIRMRSQQTFEISLMSLYTGMRAGEVFSLTWGQVDREKGTIFIPGDKSKSGKGRHVYINHDVSEMLSAKKQGQPSALVFASTKGGQIGRVSSVFGRVVDDLGLNDGRTDAHSKVVFHTLRHTFASWLAQDGLDLYKLQKLLGHSSFAMVQRYAHLCPNSGRDAVMALTAKSR